jgi:UDP-N-acetylmuramoyl-tripeptide--D-alanyl-D-alanine ligase
MSDKEKSGRVMVRRILQAASEPFYAFKRRARRQSAKFWRRQFSKTTFIGVTGSHGKTTATALLGAILEAEAPTYVQVAHNQTKTVAKTVLRTRPWRHRYCVQEVSGERPTVVGESVDILQPSVGIVTAISGDHRKAYGGSMEAIAAEKAKLVHRLPPDGLAVLNADDSLVAGMGEGCSCRVVSYGRREGSHLRLLRATSVWPERLEFEVSYRGESFSVRTQLVGAHWAGSAMAALLAALELGVARSTCVSVIEAFAPMFNRMSVHPGPNGAWYVLDANKASFSGIEACLGFLGDAVAPRKTVVVGTIADYAGASRAHYYKVARMALDRADRVIFTGANANRVRRLVADELAGRLFVRERPEDMLQMLSEDALPDEIIYVKATRIDRLARFFVPDAQRNRPNQSSASRFWMAWMSGRQN